MAWPLTTPVASTSTGPDNAITNVNSESTEKQTVNVRKKKDEVNYNLATWWLRMVEPRRAPYFPQIKDKIVYLRQAHEYYLREVKEKKIFDVTESDKLWVQMNIFDYEYLTVDKVSFQRYPTRVACLKVKKYIKGTEGTEQLPVFELKYHDMEGVVDFLVLKHIFDEGLVTKWNVGDPFRYLIDNMWYSGTIVSIKPQYQLSPFKSFQIKWDDDGELDQMSPWEIQRINANRLPENHGEPVEVELDEIENMRYEPCADDWSNWEDWRTTINNTISEFNVLMALPISKCFIEIKQDPIYDALVPYPVDLSTIKQRIHNHFYRRIDALEMDISYLEDNAEEHKSEKFFEEAKLIAKACRHILSTGEANREQLSIDIISLDSDDDNEFKIFGSCNTKEDELSYKHDWKKWCKLLLNILGDSEDMYPFRQPVSREDYPDYYEVISSPICFEEITTKFNSNLYKSPKKVFDDIKLITKNSYKFNQNEQSAIYYATKGVEALFKELRKQINIKKEGSRKNKPIPSRREKQKKSNKKSNEETLVFKKEKCQQMNRINRKSSNQDENNADVTETHSKNNNYTKDLSKTSTNGNYTNLAVETSNFTVTKPNQGKEKKCSEKENMQKQDSMKRKRLSFMNEHNSNESSKKKLHISAVEINTKNLLHQAHFVNSNEDDRMEVVEGNNKTNNSNSSEFDNDDCEIIENNCTDQIKNEPKSSQILQSQIEVSSDLFDLQVIKEEHEHQNLPKSCYTIDVIQSPNQSTENGNKDINMSLQNNYNEGLSKASSAIGNVTNLAVQALNLAVIQIKEEEIQEIERKIFKEVDLMKQEVVQSVNEKNSESPKINVNNDDCEIIENDRTHDQFNNEPNSYQISQLQRTDSIDSIIVTDSDNDDDEEYGKGQTNSFADDPTHSQAHCTANTNGDVNKCLQERSNFKSSHASIKEKSMNMNEDKEKHQIVTKSSITTSDFTQWQAHYTESTNEFHADPKSSYILQSQIEVSTGSFDLRDINEEQQQELQDSPKSCYKVDFIQSPNHSTENGDKDVNMSLMNNDDCEIIENDRTDQFNNEPNSYQISQLQRTDSIDSIIVTDSDNDDDEEHGKVTKNFGKADDPTHSQAQSTANTNGDVNKYLKEQSNFKSSLASIETNSMNMDEDEENHETLRMSCIKTGDFTQSQAHCTENTNQINLEPQSSQILQLQIQGSADSSDPQDIKEEQDEDVNDSLQKKLNTKESLATLKAREQMQLKYIKRIFQRRSRKSCVLCQCIKKTFLTHLKSHHTFNIR